jgi:hypothetical protein
MASVFVYAGHRGSTETVTPRGQGSARTPNCNGSHPVFGETVIRTDPELMSSDRGGLLTSRSIY